MVPLIAGAYVAGAPPPPINASKASTASPDKSRPKSGVIADRASGAIELAAARPGDGRSGPSASYIGVSPVLHWSKYPASRSPLSTNPAAATPPAVMATRLSERDGLGGGGGAGRACVPAFSSRAFSSRALLLLRYPATNIYTMLSVLCGSRQLLLHAHPSSLVQHFIESRHRIARTSSTMVLAIDSYMFICMHGTKYAQRLRNNGIKRASLTATPATWLSPVSTSSPKPAPSDPPITSFAGVRPAPARVPGM